MIDSRVQTTESGNAIVCPYTGQRFKFDSPSSRVKALDAFRQHTDAVIARREKIAGRTLTARELVHGVQHADLRDALTRAHDNAWRPTPVATEQESKHPFDVFGDTEKPKTWKQFDAEMRAKYDARVGKKPDVSEQQREAEECARQAWEDVAFDSTATAADVQKADRLRQQAAGDLEVFASLYSEHLAACDAREAMRRAELGARIADLEQQRLPRFNEPKPEPAPDPVKPKSDAPEHFSQVAIDNADPATAERMRQSNEAFWQWRTSRNEGGQQ